MPVIPVSAVDAVSPAIQRTRRLLFQPFRFSVWWRLALIGLLTGEMSSGGFRFNVPSFPRSSGNHSDQFLPSSMAIWTRPHVIALIVLAALVATVLILGFMYVGSVLRFVLLEGVLSGTVRIREGFRRWRERGAQFFVWQIFFQIIFLSTLAIVIGLPLLLAWRAGLFRDPRGHLGILILGGLVLFSVGAVIVVVSTTIWVLTKDFVVPLMALDGVGPIEGWRRLLPMIGSSKASYAGYIGMKIVLALAVALLFTLFYLVLILVLLIPVGITAVLAVLVASAIGVGWNVFTITLAVVAGVILGAILICVIMLTAVPVVVFFQSYVLQFFGSRYGRLAALVYPEPPSAPPAAPAPLDPGPLPSPA